MRQRNVKNCDEILLASDKYIQDISKLKELIKSGEYKNIYLEIGIGKGAFIAECARRHKENLYIGIELNKGVVSLATKKISRFETEIGESLTNLKVLDYNALELENIFDERSVDKIYLNFSDPWPKKRHAKRRLTSHVFLPVYDKIFKDSKTIIQKTDNVGLYESSLVSLSTYGYTILEMSLDLASTGMENSLTEYEAKFMSQGIKINYLKAFKK